MKDSLLSLNRDTPRMLSSQSPWERFLNPSSEGLLPKQGHSSDAVQPESWERFLNPSSEGRSSLPPLPKQGHSLDAVQPQSPWERPPPSGSGRNLWAKQETLSVERSSFQQLVPCYTQEKRKAITLHILDSIFEL